MSFYHERLLVLLPVYRFFLIQETTKLALHSYHYVPRAFKKY